MAIIQTDMNATELRIIEVVDKYVIYMLTENDKEKIIYSKLLELEGQELTDWINEELVEWLGNNIDYEYENVATISSISINDYIQDILSKENDPISRACPDHVFYQQTTVAPHEDDPATL
jgi:hypothetical protein